MALDGDQNNKSRKTNPVISRLGILVLIAFCLVFVSSYTTRLVRKAEVEREILEWEQRIEEAEARQLELLQELSYVQSDAYVESVARTDLDMARPGDTVLMVMDNVPESVEAPFPTVEAEGKAQMHYAPNGPVWRQWVFTFFGD